ncbi:SRPBCC family protein [Aeromicrobium sp.]|nr:SRPBCC family protein [Candidatus Saccharibacteria bacterium]
MNTITLTFKIDIQATQQTVFEYVSDWERQSGWIPFTTVKNLSESVKGQGASLLAVTGFGPLKFSDTMVVTTWQPYDTIVVEHTGRIVLGKGVFSVHPHADDSCTFVWQEITPVPFGLIGQAGLFLIKPLMNSMFDRALKKLKSNIELNNYS